MRVLRRFLQTAAFVSATAALAAPAYAQDGLAGAYLAARTAAHSNDYRAAAEFFSAAIVRDPNNQKLLEYAITAHVGLGNFSAAGPLADRMAGLSVDNQAADIVRLARDLKRKDYAAAKTKVTGGALVGPLVDGLIGAWIEVAEGRFSEARIAFDEIAGREETAVFGLYHKALALALVGDFEAAAAIFAGSGGADIPPTRRGVLAYVQILSQLERNEDALALIEQTFGAESDPQFAALAERLRAGDRIAFDTVRSAEDGLSEVFFTVASLLQGQAADSVTLIFARTAEYLRPDDAEQILLVASVLTSQRQYELAAETFAKVPTTSPMFYAAEIGRSNVLARSGNTEAAIEVMQQLSRSFGDFASVHVALGDRLRSEERYGEAAAAYGRAIDLFGAPRPEHWPVYYSRGIGYERTGEWDKAEADFRQALALQPDQPQVLNYLGYSLVEKGEKLEEALQMIKEAVAARPEDGFITDSLGWAFYRLGRYEDAVAPMERAAELEPTDPVINDHLGDVYWAVGRKLEARFQWRRALSFDPEEKDANRIRRKLEVGLDRVLEEEGAPPLREANAVAADN